MCGLVGLAGDLMGGRRKAFDELLIADVVRGPHSTGVASVERHNNRINVVKSVGIPQVLMSTKEYNKAIQGQLKALIGHNRWATIGQVTDNNAHPFLHGNIVGAHNGTLEYGCRSRLHNSNEYGTDSEAIFADIQHNGLAETQKLLNNPSFDRNAYALVWYDRNNDSINFYRNDGRTLFYAFSEDGCTIFWASEVGILRWVLGRNGLKLNEDKVYYFEKDFHYSWKIPESVKDAFGEATRVKYDKPDPIYKPYEFKHDSWKPNHHRQENVFPFFGLSKPKEDLLIDTKKWRPPYKDHKGLHLKKEQVEDMTKGGCVFCPEAKFKWGDFAYFCKPDIDGRTIWLCEQCYNDDDIRDVCKELM